MSSSPGTRLHRLLLLLSLLAAPAAAALAEPAGQGAAASEPAAEESTDTARPAPAEPIPAASPAAPVMPAIVVRPSGVQEAETTRPAGAKKPPDEQRPRSVSLGRHGVIELGRPPQVASRWRGFPISLSLRDAPLAEVLRSFARIAGVNLVLDPQVKGEVTVELQDVPWDQALYVILKSQGLAAEIDGNVWVVEP